MQEIGGYLHGKCVCLLEAMCRVSIPLCCVLGSPLVLVVEGIALRFILCRRMTEKVHVAPGFDSKQSASTAPFLLEYRLRLERRMSAYQQVGCP